MNRGEVSFLIVRQTGEGQAVVGQYADKELAQEVVKKLNAEEPEKSEKVMVTYPMMAAPYTCSTLRPASAENSIKPAIYVVVGVTGFSNDVIGWYKILIKKGWPR